MTVTLNISSQSLKITAGRNALIEKWGTLAVAPGLIKDGLILEPDAIGKQLKTYFENEYLQSNNVVVSLSGASYVYRLLRLPHLPPKRLREAIERATQKEVNLDLADLYIDWDIVGDKDGETEVFVTGIPRRSIEALIQALSTAKIKPLRVELSSLALAKAANQFETVLVNLEPECFDIVIISGGIPVTLHSILPRTRGANLEDQIMQFTDELTRTIDFYNLTHKENTITPGASLVLSGSLAVDTASAESIHKVLGYNVFTFKPEVVYPPDFPFMSYSINLGLALKKSVPKIKELVHVKVYQDINIDLLRARKRARTQAIATRHWLVPAGLAIAAIFLIPSVIQVNDSKVQSAVLKSDLAATIHQLNQKQLTLEQDSELHKTVDALNEDTRKIQRDIELVAGKGELNQLLKIITDNLPSGVIFSDIDCGSKQIIINGSAANRTAVISYARTMEKTQKFSSVRIALLKESAGENGASGATFRLTIDR